MIDLINVSKVFYQSTRETVALDNVSLHVPAGSIYGVIGASGAGKSTLIRCVNLLEKPTSGEILVNGKSLLQLSPRELAIERRRIGMIFQQFNLLASRTVFDNVAFSLELNNTPKATRKERVMELLSLVGLADRADDYPATLSGGQKQRVAIARTLASQPTVLLCDEATSALDPATTRSILTLLKDINQRLKLTILLITHEMEVVKAICDEVAVIHAGQLVEQGTVMDVFTHPKTELTRRFINASLHVAIPAAYAQRLQPTNTGLLHPLLRLEVTGKTVTEPILSEAARLFAVDVMIISAQMDHAGSTSFGVLLVELAGNTANHLLAITFFNEKQITVDLLGYV